MKFIAHKQYGLLIIYIAIACISIFIFDSFAYRDTYIDIGNGYRIIATSAASLTSVKYNGKLSELNWSAYEHSDTAEKFTLQKITGERRVFSSEDDWRRAIHDTNANPHQIAPAINDVKCYLIFNGILYGEGDVGYFALDTQFHKLRVWKYRDEWEKDNLNSCDLSKVEFLNPHSSVNWNRGGKVLLIYVLIIFLVLRLSLFVHRRRVGAMVQVRREKA